MLLRAAISKPYHSLLEKARRLSKLQSPSPLLLLDSSANKRSLVFVHPLSRNFSSDDRRGGDNDGKLPSGVDTWDLSWTGADRSDPFTFEEEEEEAGGGVSGDRAEVEPWLTGRDEEDEGGVFANVEQEVVGEKGHGGAWNVAEGYQQWTLSEEEGDEEGKSKGDELFDIGEVDTGYGGSLSGEEMEDEKVGAETEKLLLEEEDLKGILKGPKHAFGDLIAASGITNAMMDNLIALKDFKGVDGLPPLSEIEDMRYEKNTRKATRADVERQKQEEIEKARVRQVDDRGRAYGTGRRKCSIARVWVQHGTGNFIVNDKQFDFYFPDLGHRATLLRPFSETNTLGQWDVKCTVKGGGVSGQVGAVRLGISRALQNLNPGFRPALKAAGFLKRDPRIVERKKPGKAKARKSFQWVKR